MLRDSPEMSPCSDSGKLDCTTFTEAVSMTPTPTPIRNSPGQNVTMPESARTSAISSSMPIRVTPNPAMISHRCGWREAIRWANADAARMPIVAGVSINPVSIAL